MSDVDYFEGYIGQAVQIQNTSYPETWVVTEKVHETLSEHDRYEYEELNCISGAYGTFICTNTNDPSQVIMRVYLQCVYPWYSFALSHLLTSSESHIPGLPINHLKIEPRKLLLRSPVTLKQSSMD